MQSITPVISTMLKTTIEEKPWVLIKFSQALVCPLGAAGILFGVTVIAWYFGTVEELYRPITNGAATHPLTAICMMLFGFPIRNRNRNNHKYERRLSRFLAFIAIVDPTILGYLLIESLHSSNVNLFGIFVVTICWFIILMVSVFAIFPENSCNLV